MKLKPLHPKKNFLKFLSLAILVLGGSVGVILATQEQVFDEPEAWNFCPCDKKLENYTHKCVDNKIKVCKCNNTTGICGFVETYSGNCTKAGKICIEGPSCDASCKYDPDQICTIGGMTIGEFRCQPGSDTKRDICSSEGLWKYYDDCAIYGMRCQPDARKCIPIPKKTEKPTVKPTSTIKPKPTTTTAQCEYSCVANCTSSGGGVRKSGTCPAGKYCCALPYTPY